MDDSLSPVASAMDRAASPGWTVVAEPPERLAAVVVVPARDEARGIEGTLAALAAQCDAQGEPLARGSFEVLVLANNCSDDTAEVARRFARRSGLALHVGEVALPAAEAHVGRARRLLMDEACRRLERAGAQRGVIASTDADTRVAPDWLWWLRAELDAGADAVGGRILPAATGSGQACGIARRLHLQDAGYRLLRARLEHLLDPDEADPWPRHHQHFGANLALTLAAYRRVGGLPVVRFLEDEALVAALRRHDLRVRHSPRPSVTTSDRFDGRVEVGLSWQLRQWASLAGEGREPLVEGAAQLAEVFASRRALRDWWPERRTRSHAGLAARLGVDPGALGEQLTRGFGSLWAWVEQEHRAAARWAPVPLGEALAGVREAVRSLGGLNRVQLGTWSGTVAGGRRPRGRQAPPDPPFAALRRGPPANPCARRTPCEQVAHRLRRPAFGERRPASARMAPD